MKSLLPKSLALVVFHSVTFPWSWNAARVSSLWNATNIAMLWIKLPILGQVAMAVCHADGRLVILTCNNRIVYSLVYFIIPRALYWNIVTKKPVNRADIFPQILIEVTIARKCCLYIYIYIYINKLYIINIHTYIYIYYIYINYYISYYILNIYLYTDKFYISLYTYLCSI